LRIRGPHWRINVRDLAADCFSNDQLFYALGVVLPLQRPGLPPLPPPWPIALALAVTDGHYANLEFDYGALVLSARAKLRFCSGVP